MLFPRIYGLEELIRQNVQTPGHEEWSRMVRSRLFCPYLSFCFV